MGDASDRGSRSMGTNTAVPTGGAVESVSATVEVAPGTTETTETVGSVVETVTSAVGEPITEPLPPTEGTVEATVDTTTGTVEDTVGTVAETGTAAAESISETVNPAGESVTEKVNSTKESVEQMADAAAKTVDDMVESMRETANQAVEAVTTGATTQADETTNTAGNAAETVAQSVAETTAPVADTAQPIADAAGPAADAGAVLSLGDQMTGPVALSTPDAVVPPNGDATADAILNSLDMTGTEPGLAPVAPTSTSPSDVFLDTLLGQDPTVVQTAAVTGLAAIGAATIVRGLESPTTSILFTNIRLLPGFVNATIERSEATAMALVPRFGTAADARGILADASAIVRDGIPKPAVPSVDSILGPTREGFDRGVGRVVPDDEGDGLRDSRLRAQLGIVLGLVYLAFLTVWFWATRVRWNPRKLT
jgi:vacuolar-type H+-ATPase subunit H